MLFNRKLMALAMTAVLSAGLLAGCGSKEESAEGAADPAAAPGSKIILVGSTSVDPLAQKLAEAYKAKTPDVDIEIQAVGSSAGIKAALDGSATIGMSSRELKEEEIAEGANPLIICRDGIAVAVNPENPVQNLSKDQVQKIFMGEITNWKEVGGNDEEIILSQENQDQEQEELLKKSLR